MVKNMKFKRVYIEITNSCNLKCSFCTLNKRTTKMMSIDEFNQIIKKLKYYTDYLYLHVLGEPLLHPQLKDFITLASQYFKINITTNGTLVHRNLSWLQLAPIHQLNISIHNFDQQEIDEETYLQQMLIDSELLSKNMYVSLRFWNSTNQEFNQDTLKLLALIQSQYPFDLDKFISKGRITLAKNLFLNTQNQFVWPSLNNDYVGHGRCLGGSEQLAILVDGSVVPCCLDGDGSAVLGNVLNECLSNVLESERYVQLINGFKKQQCSEELCLRCSFKNRFNK